MMKSSGGGNNNQRKSKQDLELMKLRRAPICEVIVPLATSQSALMVKSNQADNEDSSCAVISVGNNNYDCNNDLIGGHQRQPVQNQPDLVALSHELSKRRFFEKLQRRESNLNAATSQQQRLQQQCGRQLGTMYAAQKSNEEVGEHDDKDQLRVLPLESADHATREPSSAHTIKSAADEQIPAPIVHLEDLNASSRRPAANSEANQAGRVAPSSSWSLSSSSASSSSSAAASLAPVSARPPWLIENHGYASLAATSCSGPSRPASSERQYANLPPLALGAKQMQKSTTSVPVGYATVRASGRIPMPPTAENKKHSTSLGEDDERTSTGSESSETTSGWGSRSSGRRRERPHSSASSGGFVNGLHPTPAAVRSIDPNRFANGNHFIASGRADELTSTRTERRLASGTSPPSSSSMCQEAAKKDDVEASTRNQMSASQRWHARKSSMLKRFGSLASRAFASTSTPATVSVTSPTPASTAHSSQAPQQPLNTHEPPESPCYSTPKLLATATLTSESGSSESDPMNFVALKTEANAIINDSKARLVPHSKEDSSQVADSTPDLRGPAPASSLTLAEADLVILPTKSSKKNGSNNKNINHCGHYSHDYNRRMARHQSHLSRQAKGCGRRVRAPSAAGWSSSVSASGASSSQSSLVSSGHESTSERSRARPRTPRRCREGKSRAMKAASEAAARETRRACSLSDELESLMSPSEDTAAELTTNTSNTAATSPSLEKSTCDRSAHSAVAPTHHVERANKATAQPQASDSTRCNKSIATGKSRASLLRNWFASSSSSMLSLSPPTLRSAAAANEERHFSSLMIDRSHAIGDGGAQLSSAKKASRKSKWSPNVGGPASMALYSSVRTAAQIERPVEPKSSPNICESMSRNYEGRGHHQRNHHHHLQRSHCRHHHLHHHHHQEPRQHTHSHGHGHRRSHTHGRGHHQLAARHAHCVSLPLTSTAATTTPGRGRAADYKNPALSCSSCCSSNGKSVGAACVWGQLIKISKSDGSQVVELERAPSSPWGFFVARGAINNVKGIFISRMHDNNSLAGLLSIGDRILSIDNCPVQEPDFDILRVNQMISKKSKISLRVKPFKG